MNKDIRFGILSRLNSLNDSLDVVNDNGEEGGAVKVIVRKAIPRNDSSKGIEILAENDYPEIGDAVKMGDVPAKDGMYSFNDGDEDITVQVKNGVIIGMDEQVSDVQMVKAMRGGKLVKVKKAGTYKKMRLSAAQKAALKKNLKKAHTGSAMKKRLKSFAKGQAMGLHSSDTESFNISKVDLVELGDKLYETVFKALVEKYELSDEAINTLDELLGEEACKVVMDGNKLKFIVPMFIENNDEISLEDYDHAELVYELKGEFDSEGLYKALTEGDLALQSNIII